MNPRPTMEGPARNVIARCLGWVHLAREGGDPEGPRQGTGFFITPNRIVTAHHILEPLVDRATQSDQFVSVMVGMQPNGWFAVDLPCRVLAVDSQNDLAILAPTINVFDSPSLTPLLSTAELGNSNVAIGDGIVVAALGLGEITADNVQLIRRELIDTRVDKIAPFTRGGYTGPVFVAETEVWRGASGCPVFTRDGKVAGIATQLVMEGGTAIRPVEFLRILLERANEK